MQEGLIDIPAILQAAFLSKTAVFLAINGANQVCLLSIKQ
ncbi:hypothetical protein AB07_0644 [Citrobacter freundii]|nr:hypothetical protein AB07_0644 [Citrobacter freundii]